MADGSRMLRSVLFLGVMAFLVCVIDSRAQNTEVPKPSDCPTIMVTGPAGVSNPGDLIWFIVSMSPEASSELTFHWTTSAGQVDEGQSTKKIGVRYLMEMRGTTLTATVKISGLPTHCQNLASDGAPLIWDPGPELLSEFSVPISSISIKDLRTAAIELNKHPNDQLYIIEYFPPGTTERAIKRKRDKIMAFMVGSLKMYGPSVTIIDGEGDKPMTKIYRVPPGAPNPTP